MKLGVSGYRGFNDYHRFYREMTSFIEEHGKPTEIVSGGAKGADAMAERYAHEENIPLLVYHPDWNKHGKRAGILRNGDIVTRCTHLIAFPSRRGKGTQDAIRRARRQGKPCKEIWIE